MRDDDRTRRKERMHLARTLLARTLLARPQTFSWKLHGRSWPIRVSWTSLLRLAALPHNLIAGVPQKTNDLGQTVAVMVPGHAEAIVDLHFEQFQSFIDRFLGRFGHAAVSLDC